MPRRIQPGWRYSVAQKVLSLLFGRRWHYIAPWKKPGAAALLMLVDGKKVLLAQRAGAVEHAGCWSSIGGFVNADKNEPLAAAACREAWEEARLKLDPARFPASPAMVFMAYRQEKHEEADTCTLSCYYAFSVPEGFVERLQATEESAAYRWFDEAEIETMKTNGLIPPDFIDMRAALAETFRRIKAGETFPPLPT